MTLELKDFLQAYFDAAKVKLVVACLIVGAVIGGFTYFFVLIGEQKILWQLSPLFFGVPIVAIVGQLLRVHATYRKYVADFEKDRHYLFPHNGDGFDIVHGKSFSHVAWDDVRAVVERPRYFQFVLNKSDSIILPKRFLLQDSKESELKEIVVSQVRDKVKLLR